MTDDKKTSETPLTLKALARITGKAHIESCVPGNMSASLALYELHAVVCAELRATTDTPSPRPEPKFEKEDWVQHENGVVGQFIDSQWNRLSKRRLCYIQIEDEQCWWHEEDLLAIPPKPEKVQEGFRLTGVVKVADGSEPYVCWGSDIVESGPVAAHPSICGGRRWMVEVVDPTWVPMRRDGATYYLVEDAKCPHCHKELSA